MVDRSAALLSAILIAFLVAGCSPKNPGDDLERLAASRPSTERYVFDYAGILEEAQEYTEGYLDRLREQYGLEAVILSVRALGQTHFIEETAARILSNWQIGKDYGGRGVLLLLADQEKQAKLEVSYELEDVFTDAFCGYVADLQLKPHFLGGQLGIGLLAVMEEIEQRARIKHQGTYAVVEIEALDRKLLSGGAGARRDLSGIEEETFEAVGSKYPPGRTPEQAWQTLIQSWKDKVRDPKLGVYTEVGQLIRRDHQNLPDTHYDKNYRTYHDKPFEVIRNENYAVISFGDEKGWENSPMLFCRTAEGWKFDLVHQRRYIRRGPNPHWAVERANHPYMDLLSHCPYYEGQDIPLEGEDIYRIEQDTRLAEQIGELEAAHQERPGDPDVALRLGKLYTITSMGPRRFALLRKVRHLSPQKADLHKYLAIAHVDSMYQYESAAKEIKEYIQKAPNDVFGQNFLGYLYLCLENYQEAINAFEAAVELNPDNCYAYCNLSRCYGERSLQASKTDRKRERYGDLAIEMLRQAEKTPSADTRRINWVSDWLKKKGIGRIPLKSSILPLVGKGALPVSFSLMNE